MKKIIAFIALLCALEVSAVEVLDKLCPDDKYTNLMHAAMSAELNRAVFEHACSTISEKINPLLCKNIQLISNEEINAVGLQFFKQSMTCKQVEQAFNFWGAFSGQVLAKKLIAVSVNKDKKIISDSEWAELERFNKSNAGAAMSKAANREATDTLVRAIIDYK